MKVLFTLFLIIIITVICFQEKIVFAGTWTDNFSSGNLDSWEIPQDRVGVST